MIITYYEVSLLFDSLSPFVMYFFGFFNYHLLVVTEVVRAAGSFLIVEGPINVDFEGKLGV
jgi:hypothetical protein